MTKTAPITTPPAMVPITVKPATETLAITLTPPATVPLPLHENVVFWVAILSFVGVILSLWQAHRRTEKELAASDERLRLQLKASSEEATIERNQSREQANLDRQHAAGQAHQERITQARREVYLELISEMTKSQIALSLLPAKDIEKLDVHSEFEGLITAIAKISVLGEMNTIIKSRELLTSIQETLLRVMVRLVPLADHKDMRRRNELERDSHKAELERLLPIVNEYKRTRNHSLESANATAQLNHHYKEFEKYGNAVIDAINAFMADNRTFMDNIMVETKAISQKVDYLIYSIRDELALTTSLEELQRSSAAQHAAADASTKQMYATLDTAINA